MKLIKLIRLLCVIIIITAFSCKKDENLVKHTVGYIVGFDPCTVDPPYYGKNTGYVIVSVDLKDTLLTYCLSADTSTTMPARVVCDDNTLYIIPALYFHRYYCWWLFPDSLRYKYGVNIVYRVVKEEEKYYPSCLWDRLPLPCNIENQVVIISATKL